MKKTLFVLLALLMVGSGFAQKSPQTKLISSSENRIVVNFQLNGFSTSKVKTPQGEQFIVNVPEMAAMLEEGAPSLPFYPVPVIIGDQAEMTVNVIDAQYTDYTNMSIAPSKGNISRQVNPDDVPYTYGAMYQQNAFWPTMQAYLEKPYILRDYRGQNIMVQPFAYNPVTKTLRVYENLTLEMTKVSDNGENPKVTRKSDAIKADLEQKAHYSRRFINFDAVQAKYPFDEDWGELLIICADPYMSNLQPLVDWKNQSGRPTTLVSLSTAGGNNAQNIKNYIQNFYNDPSHNLEFILLVGEYNDLTPYCITSGYDSKYSDNWFGKLEGTDNYLEALVGRLSVANAADADVQVNKIIYYERDIMTDATWGNKGMGIGYYGAGSGHYGEDDYEHIDLIRDTLMHYTYSQVTEHHGGSGGDASVATISGTTNEGISIINYCNHGSVTSWGVAGYSTSDVAALTNDGKLPIVWSVACLNGQFDTGTCFGESWLRATNNATGAPTGAVGGMFSWISQPWIPPMYGQDEMVNILTEWRSSDLFNHTLGGASLNGSMDILDKEPNDSYQTFNTWLLFGDPSMLIRTDIPTEMGVTMDPGVLMLGMTEAQISVDADYAIATLSMEGEVIASGRIVDGQGTLTFPALTAPGMAQLVVIGYNKVTSVTNVEVVPAEGAYITVNNYAINANQANYGEDVDLSVNVKNVGVETASNMTATLTTENEYVEILAGEATIAEVNPDEIVTVEGFRFHVAENVPDGTVAQFFLNVTDGTNEWQGKFSINLHAPVIALDALIIAEDQVTFTFANHGSAPFNGGTLTLTSCSPELVFENETITLEDVVEAGTAIDLASNYTVAETVPAASSFQVAYTFTSGSFVEEGIFTIAYQVIEETFESGVFGEGWTFSTNNAWAIVDGGVKGTKCAKSMNNGIHSTDYSMTLTVDVLAEGDMTFMYKVSSENNYDKFFFYYDGVSQNPDGWSGTTMAGFEMYTKPVTVGTHTFKWEYHKDGSVSSGDDCVLIDDIKFPIVNEYIFLAPATDLMAEVSGSDVTLTWTASADATQYVIKRNGETIATVAETSYIDQLPRDGIYTYAVSAANDNGALSAPVVATVEAIFDDAAETQESLISIYPNPAKDVLNIVAGNNSIEYSLYNGMGQVVANGTATGTQQIDCSKMSKGIYFLHLNTGANAMVEKVVVK